MSQREVSASVVQDVQRKIRALDVPVGYACVPVLIYMGNLSSKIIGSDYFSEVIDVNVLLTR